MSAPNIINQQNPKINNGIFMAITATIDPASVATITTVEQDFTVTGLVAGDIVVAVNKPTCTTGLGICNARVKANDTLSLTFVNPTAGSVNAGSENYTILIYRPSQAIGTTLEGYPTTV